MKKNKFDFCQKKERTNLICLRFDFFIFNLELFVLSFVHLNFVYYIINNHFLFFLIITFNIENIFIEIDAKFNDMENVLAKCALPCN
jgi:hypothetical protein